MTKTINNQSQPNVCSVLTTFNPDDGFPDRIARIQEQVQGVIIVDDSAAEEIKVKLAGWFTGHPGIVLLHHASNKGVAAALNTGLEMAGATGYAFAVLLDDDSLVAPGMVDRLSDAFEKHLKQMSAIVGISYSCAENGSHKRNTGQLKEVLTTITAGCMIPLKIYQYVGPFREELFIDYVDHEYCLRARVCGVRIWLLNVVGMTQPIGRRHKTAWVEIRSVHSSLRTYYFFRNSLAVVQEYGWRFPKFAIWAGWQQFKTLVKIICFMRPQRLYLRAMLLGWTDGRACRFGRISDDIEMS